MTSPSRPTQSEDQVQAAVAMLRDLKTVAPEYFGPLDYVADLLQSQQTALSEALLEREAALLAKMDQAKRELSAEKVHHILTAQCLREELAEASAKIKELAIGHARYEYLRKLNPRQFTELYQQNISTAVPFDTLVDEARAPTAGETGVRS